MDGTVLLGVEGISLDESEDKGSDSRPEALVEAIGVLLHEVMGKRRFHHEGFHNEDEVFSVTCLTTASTGVCTTWVP